MPCDFFKERLTLNHHYLNVDSREHSISNFILHICIVSYIAVGAKPLGLIVYKENKLISQFLHLWN